MSSHEKKFQFRRFIQKLEKETFLNTNWHHLMWDNKFFYFLRVFLTLVWASEFLNRKMVKVFNLKRKFIVHFAEVFVSAHFSLNFPSPGELFDWWNKIYLTDFSRLNFIDKKAKKIFECGTCFHSHQSFSQELTISNERWKMFSFPFHVISRWKVSTGMLQKALLL